MSKWHIEERAGQEEHLIDGGMILKPLLAGVLIVMGLGYATPRVSADRWYEIEFSEGVTSYREVPSCSQDRDSWSPNRFICLSGADIDPSGSRKSSSPPELHPPG
jgi:hypothetical protein